MKKIFAIFSILNFSVFAFADITSHEEEVVVTATRIGEKSYKLASNITIITKEDIEASNASTIADILKQAAGIHIYDNNTSKSTYVDIRGFGDTASRNILVLINGRRINSIDIATPDLTQIPIEAVERIEIIRGAGSVFYGDNAVGGVVNIITRKGKGPMAIRAGVSGGSYDSHKIDMEVSGYKHNVSYYFYSKYNDERGYRDNSDLLARDFNTRLGYNFSEKISMDLNMGWHKSIQELPGGLLDADLASLGRKASTNHEDIAYTTDRYVKLGLDIDPWPQDIYFGEFAFDFHYRNRDVYDEFNKFGPFHTKRESDTSGVTGKYIFDKTLFNREVNFVTGIDYYDHENDILGSRDNVDDITISKIELGFFGFAEFEMFPDLFVNGGTRYHKANYTFNQRNAIVFQERKPEETVFMGGLKYEYAKGSNVHFNYQQTFRFLATDEWYSTANFPGFGITPGLNLALDQQTGVQYEAGIKHNFNDKILVNVTPYYMVLNNEIFFDPATFGNSNYDKTERIGIETGQTFDLLKFFDIGWFDKLEFVSNYTWQMPRFSKGDNDGKDIPMVPRHQVSSSLITKVFKYYQWSITGRYVGSRFAINDVQNATPPAKPYYVLDTKIAFQHKNLEIFAGINNITDELYDSFVSKSTTSTTKSHFPAPERNYVVGVNIKF